MNSKNDLPIWDNRHDVRREGFWKSEAEPYLPMPIPEQLTQTAANNVYKAIQIRESEARWVGYRGNTTSRITGESLGNGEYHHPDGWVWPEDFGPHYVRDHRVKPSQDFFIWVTSGMKFLNINEEEYKSQEEFWQGTIDMVVSQNKRIKPWWTEKGLEVWVGQGRLDKLFTLREKSKEEAMVIFKRMMEKAKTENSFKKQ